MERLASPVLVKKEKAALAVVLKNMYKRVPQKDYDNGNTPYRKTMKIFSRTGLITPSSILLSLIFWTIVIVFVYYTYSWYKRLPHTAKLYQQSTTASTLTSSVVHGKT